jgi:hypothetical protein
VAGSPAFQAVGDVFITNTSPLNAQLKEVTVSISNPFGGVPYRTTATCPLLTVAAGQTLQCRYVASPPFNPVGAQVVGIAQYLNTRNGVPTGATTPFSSAATTLAGGAPGDKAGAAPAALPASMIQQATRHLLAAADPAAADEALGNIVRRVSVTTSNDAAVGTAARARPSADTGFNLDAALTAMDTLVSTGKAAPAAGSNNGGKVAVAELLKGVVNALETKKKASLPVQVVSGLLKHLNMTVDKLPVATANNTIDGTELLAHVLPKLPSLGISMEGADWSSALSALQGLLPKMPRLPSLPKGPTITINSTGPEDPETQETKLDGLSAVLTKITNLLEHNSGATVTVTTKSLTPEGMLNRALDAIGTKDDAPEAPAPDAGAGNGTVVAGAAAPVSPSELRGLSDECVDIQDAFASGQGFTTGMVVSGSLPKDRICDTTTFTYTVRYGPYADCFDKKAVNRAQFTTANTNATGEASTTVNVKVDGCGPAVASAVKSYASWARKGYTWTVEKSVSPARLALTQGQQGTAMYTVAFTRLESLVAPKLSATVQFDNLNAQKPVTLSAFSYKVTSQCASGSKSASGTFNCGSNTIPAGGAPLTCKFSVDLPCTAPGVLVAHAAAGDKAVRSTPFNFPAPEAVEMPESAEGSDPLSTGECVMVSVLGAACWALRAGRCVLGAACWACCREGRERGTDGPCRAAAHTPDARKLRPMLL